jgi:repressor LexA
MGIRSTNGVNDHLRALERKGYLTRKDMKSRTLRPTTAPQRALGSADADLDVFEQDEDNLIDVPIIGQVAAGALHEAIQHTEDHVRIDRMLIGGQRDVFGLRIRGESMIDAGIHDGDYVFVRKQIDATRGQVVIALVGEEATCKYFFPERDHVRLQPANQNMGPIIVPRTDWRDTQLLGVVVGVYRKLSA